MALYIIGPALLTLSVLSSLELAAADDDMCHSLCMLFAQPASGILYSGVNLVCHYLSVDGPLLSGNDQSLSVRTDVAFIKPLICERHVCNF